MARFQKTLAFLCAVALLVSGMPAAIPAFADTDGEDALKVSLSGTPSWEHFFQNTAVDQNSVYEASFWMKGEGKISLKILKDDWSKTYAEQSFTATDEWTKYTITGIQTADNSYLTFAFMEGSDVAGTILIDDCFLGFTGGENKLRNPGFEEGINNWSGSETVYGIASGEGHVQGLNGLKIVESGVPTWEHFFQNTAVDQNSIYEASFWMKGKGKISLKILKDDWSKTYAEQSFTATDEWAKYTISGIQTADNSYLTFAFMEGSDVAGTIFIDDCFLGLPGGENKLKNPGFEDGSDNWSGFGTVYNIASGEGHIPPSCGIKIEESGTPSWEHFFQNTAVTQNSVYEASFWMKGKGKISLKILKDDWSKTYAEQTFTATNEWKKYTRICDFDVFGRDHLMSRLIYIRDNSTGEYWNVNWEPVRKAYDSYECIHGLGYTEIKTRVNGINSGFKIFIPSGNDPVELWRLKTVNVSGEKKNLSIFVYNQFQFKYKWGFDSYGDMIYRTNWLNRELNSVVAVKHPFRKPHEYLTGFVTSDEKIEAFDGNRESFVGVYNTLADPQAVVKGYCSNTPGSADATVVAFQYNLELEDKQEKDIYLILGATYREENIRAIREKYLGKFDEFLNEVIAEKEKLTEKNFFKTPNRHMNRILNYWVKQATQYGATWCRWGWNGYRDIVQHGLGVSVQDPTRTKNILLEAFSYQYSNGLAVRGWNPVDEKAYSDSALWLVFTLTEYLKETGDMELLDQVIPYHDKGSATVRQHIDTALDFLENNKGSHDLILIKFGDWNDSLTGVGKEGRGESVWLSLAYAEAMREMAELAEFINDQEKQKDYLARRDRIIEAINKNAWDGSWYARCFDDNGRAIGSCSNEFARIFMEPQSWALISGAADHEKARAVIESCDKLLNTDLGYLLLAPPFTRIDNNIGRISSMEPGIAENGTIYTHVNVWMILGLLRYGMADKAYELFRKISPGYIDDGKSPKNNCPPYMYANCYFGPDHKNNKFQMEFTWITGSVAWFNNVILKEMLGAKANYRGLEIDPCIPSEWESYEVRRYFRGSWYHITVRNPEHIQRGKVVIAIDSVKSGGNLLPVFSDGKVHRVDVIIQS